MRRRCCYLFIYRQQCVMFHNPAFTFTLTWLLTQGSCIHLDNISIAFLVFVSHLNERALAGSLAY